MELDHNSAARTVAEVASAAAGAASQSMGNPIILGGTALATAAGLAAIVVMLMTKPKTEQEWAVALISTLVSSLCGGAFVILKMGWIVWIQTTSGAQLATALMAFGGVIFTCGLPGWVLVRLMFNTMEKHKDQTLSEAYHDIKQEVTK